MRGRGRMGESESRVEVMAQRRAKESGRWNCLSPNNGNRAHSPVRSEPSGTPSDPVGPQWTPVGPQRTPGRAQRNPSASQWDPGGTRVGLPPPLNIIAGLPSRHHETTQHGTTRQNTSEFYLHQDKPDTSGMVKFVVGNASLRVTAVIRGGKQVPGPASSLRV